MEVRPIPAFYCCYLLRPQTPRATALYIGSTPNPSRRLRQHNGDGKGGAAKTRNRKWKMDCIVTGFPSKIAALQFEWAWQHTHKTLRISAEERISKVPEKKRNRNGHYRMPQPKFTLKDRLQNLHLLLRVPSFAKWPLNVRFFCEDLWERWHQTTKDLNQKEPLRSDIKVVLDLKQGVADAEPNKDTLNSHEKGRRRKEAVGRGGVDGVDIGYSSIKDHFEKSRSLFKSDQAVTCSVCTSEISSPGEIAVTCPNRTCTAACHLSCLAERFLEHDEASGSLLPTFGRCPKCRINTRWSDLVMEMSLRARGSKDLARLLKESLRKKTQKTKSNDSTIHSVDPDVTDENDEMSDDPLPDDWQHQEDDDEDRFSVASASSEVPSRSTSSAKQRPQLVIEDSEWDSAEKLE